MIFRLVQRRAIKKVIQPCTGSKNNYFANINCCYHTNARNCGALRYELRHTKTTYENDVRRTKNSYYVGGQKFIPRRPLNFCVTFLHVLHKRKPGAGICLFVELVLCIIYWLKSTKFRVYAHKWVYGFWLITQSFFVQSRYKCVYKFRRLLAVSKVPKI